MSTIIIENGGKIVDLDEPKLTHIVLDKRDDSRRLELMKRTAKSVYSLPLKNNPYMCCHFRPKRRHLVISDFLQACLDEGTLLDEDGKPSRCKEFTEPNITGRVQNLPLRYSREPVVFVSCKLLYLPLSTECAYISVLQNDGQFIEDEDSWTSSGLDSNWVKIFCDTRDSFDHTSFPLYISVDSSARLICFSYKALLYISRFYNLFIYIFGDLNGIHTAYHFILLFFPIFFELKSPAYFPATPFAVIMADPQISPISQLLSSMGLTREDLHKRSDQMRQFLTAEDSNSLRVLDNVKAVSGSNTNSDTRPGSKSSTSSRSMARSISRASSMSFRDASPPATPVKHEPVEGGLLLRRVDSMEVVIERQRRQNKKEKKARRERERGTGGTMGLPPHPPSPSPTNASHTGFSLDSFMKSRDGRRVTVSGEDTNDESGVLQVRSRIKNACN